jgi:hypothetical protein
VLDALLARHLILQAGRIAIALFLFLILAALGAALLRRFRVALDEPAERLLLQIATGFAAYQCIVRWLAELQVVQRAGIFAIVLLLGLAGTREWRTLRDDMRALRWPRGWPAFAILLLVIAPLVMALAPAVSRDALIYHLRFPEMTLRAGAWAYDLATGSSFYPAAIGTLYLPALAADAQGVAAQLVHYGFFLLSIAAVAAISRRLGAPTGSHAAILFAAVPAAGIVAGWAWADAPLLFALATSALALLAGAPALAIVLLALAASVKYTALLAGAPLFVAAIIALVRTRDARRLFAGVVLGILVLSPWYATNAWRTGNPLYPLGATTQPTTEMVATWSSDSDAHASWARVWTGYFFRPQTLDEDIGGPLFLAVGIAGLALAFTRGGKLRIAALIAAAMWLPFLPLTAAMRLLLPAVMATLVVAGAALEQLEQKRLVAAIFIAFAIRGGIVTASHNANFFNPLPAAAGIESEAAYIRRNFAPAPLFERADAELPPNARVLAINEVRLFRFPRSVTASRVLDAPLLRRYTAGANDLATVVQRLHADHITHLLAATRPVERGVGIPLTPQEEKLTRSLIHNSRMIDREGDIALFELP